MAQTTQSDRQHHLRVHLVDNTDWLSTKAKRQVAVMTLQCDFRFVLIYFLVLVLVLVFQLFFSFSFVLVFFIFSFSFSFVNYYLVLIAFPFFSNLLTKTCF